MKKVIECKEEFDSIDITGYIGKPETQKKQEVNSSYL